MKTTVLETIKIMDTVWFAAVFALLFMAMEYLVQTHLFSIGWNGLLESVSWNG